MLPMFRYDLARIALESPYSVAANRRFSGADYDAIRPRTGEDIISLQVALRQGLTRYRN